MLALPEGYADAWRRYDERCTATGPWPAFERELSASLTAALVDDDGAVPLLAHSQASRVVQATVPPEQEIVIPFGSIQNQVAGWLRSA